MNDITRAAEVETVCAIIEREKIMKPLIVKVAGHEERTLRFYPKSSCGGIKNGVGFANGKQGGWVISYEDFLEMVRLVEEARQPEKPEPLRGEVWKIGDELPDGV